MKRQAISARVRRELKAKDRKWLDELIVAVRARIESYNQYLDRVGGPLSYRGQERQCVDRLRRDEALLLRVGHAYQEAASWHHQRPALG